MVSTNYNNVKQTKLADLSNTENKNINILIGLDFCYLFVTSHIIRGESNKPIPLNSVFGWILCGSFVETTQANLNITHLFHVDTLRNKVGRITKERNPFEFDFNNDLALKRRCF